MAGITAPAVLGAARTRRPQIRKQAPSMPHTLVKKILPLAQNATVTLGLRAFAAGIASMILAKFRWADAQWITDIDKNDFAAFGI